MVSRHQACFIIVCLLPFAFARDYECDPRYVDDDGFQKIQPILSSNGDTIGSRIDNSTEMKTSINELQGHMELLREYIHESNKTGNATEERCVGGSDGIIRDRARVYGFREPELECFSAFTESSEYTVNEIVLPAIDPRVLIKAIENLASGLNNFGKDIIKGYKLNWKKVLSNDIFNLESKEFNIRNCTGYRAIGYRVDGEWAIGVKLYDETWDIEAGDRKRVGLTEFITLQNNQARTKTLSIPFCDEKHDAVNFSSGSAVVKYESGQVGWEHGHDSNLEDHFGIKMNLAKSLVDKELVQDSGAASNGAVLLLPVVLTFLPLGLFQEVSLTAAIVYSIATDLISVTPVLIKGFELLLTGNRKYYSVVSRIYGSSNVTEPGWAQIWPSVCTVNPRIRNIGIIYLCIGFIAMIIGIILEILSFVAIRRAKRRHRVEVKRLLESDGSPDLFDDPSRGAGLLWYWNNKKID